MTRRQFQIGPSTFEPAFKADGFYVYEEYRLIDRRGGKETFDEMHGPFETQEEQDAELARLREMTKCP